MIPDPALAVSHSVYEAVAQRYVVQVIRHYVGASYKWAKSSCKSPRQSLLGLQSWALLVTSSSSFTSQCTFRISWLYRLVLMSFHSNNILVYVQSSRIQCHYLHALQRRRMMGALPGCWTSHVCLCTYGDYLSLLLFLSLSDRPARSPPELWRNQSGIVFVDVAATFSLPELR